MPIVNLLGIYIDIMSAAGRILANCQLIITNRVNASLTCGRTTCKKERLYKANDDYKKRAMADPIRKVYLNFDKKGILVVFQEFLTQSEAKD